MIAQSVYPFEQLQQMCREMNAPVFVRHKRHSDSFRFVRRSSASVEDVERFFSNSLTVR